MPGMHATGTIGGPPVRVLRDGRRSQRARQLVGSILWQVDHVLSEFSDDLELEDLLEPTRQLQIALAEKESMPESAESLEDSNKDVDATVLETPATTNSEPLNVGKNQKQAKATSSSGSKIIPLVEEQATQLSKSSTPDSSFKKQHTSGRRNWAKAMHAHQAAVQMKKSGQIRSRHAGLSRAQSLQLKAKLADERTSENRVTHGSQFSSRKMMKYLNGDSHSHWDYFVSVVLHSNNLVFDPEQRIVSIWHIVISIFVLYTAAVVPLRLGISDPSAADAEKSEVMKVLDIISELVFLFDIWVNFHLGYLDPGINDIILDTKLIRKHYMSSWFFVDSLGSIPFDIIAQLTPMNSNFRVSKILRLFKLFRLVRLLHLGILSDLEHMWTPGNLRLIKILGILVLILHCIACAYWFLSVEVTGFRTVKDKDGWAPHERFKDALWIERYLVAFYWATNVLIGNSTKPESTVQFVFSNICLLIGMVVFGSIIAGMASLVTAMDALADSKKNQIDSINKFLTMRRVDKRVRKRIRMYYDYLWESGLSASHDEIFKELPSGLKLQLSIELKRKLVIQIPMFRKISPQSVVAIMSRLSTTIHMPDDMLCVRGEVGDRMFFIFRGVVAILVQRSHKEPEKEDIARYMHDGGHFGENCLFGEGDRVRTASVKALSICEVEILLKVDFDFVSEVCPDVQNYLKQSSTRNQSRFLTEKKSSHDASTKLSRSNSLAELMRTQDLSEHSHNHLEQPKRQPAISVLKNVQSAATDAMSPAAAHFRLLKTAVVANVTRTKHSHEDVPSKT